MLCEAPVSAEPCEDMFNDPSPWFLDEVPDALGAGDDVDGAGFWISDGIEGLSATISAVSEGEVQAGIGFGQCLEERAGPVAVLHVGGRDQATS